MRICIFIFAMEEELIPRRSVLSSIGATSLALAGVSAATEKPALEDTLGFEPHSLDEIRQFQRALVGKYSRPNEYEKRAAIIERLDEEQRTAYYDATDVHWIRRHKYGITADPEVSTRQAVMLNDISVERVNKDLTERWDWDVSDSKPEKIELVDIDQKVRTLQQDNVNTNGSVSSESTIGETVTASNSLTQVYEFGYEVTWEYSYHVEGQFGEPVYSNESVDDVGPKTTDGNPTSVDWSYHGSSNDTDTSETEFTSWSEGVFKHERVDGTKTYNPYIEVTGDALGNGQVNKADNGR